MPIFSGFGLHIRDGSIEAIAKSTGTAGIVSAPFDHTDWTHVAVVFDRGALRIYVNGGEVAANPNGGYDTVGRHIAGSELGGNTTTIPWVSGERNKFFAGHVDATSIHNRALSADRIADLADAF